MNAKISVLVICVEVIIYLILGNLHDCAFKDRLLISKKISTCRKHMSFLNLLQSKQ